MRYDTPMGQPPLPAATPPPPAAKSSTSTLAYAKAPLPPTTLSAAPTASLSSSSPALTLSPTGGASAIPISDLPLRQQLKHGLRDMYRSSLASGRNFAKVGAIFSGTECAIEGLRAKNDLYNGVAGGCITGGVLARNAGPQAALIGCAGFAAFSAAIDAYMRMPEDERSRPIA
jgi:import inner membrane translocase subunit TIM22